MEQGGLTLKPWKLNDIPYYDTFLDFVNAIKANHGSKPCIVQYDRAGNPIVHTYDEMCFDALGLSQRLYEMGLTGKHIAIAGGNSYDWLVAFLGITCSGGISVNIDIEQPDSIIREMITESDSVAVFASPDLADICHQLLREGAVSHVFTISSKNTGEDSLTAMCKQGAQAAEPFVPQLSPDQTASIVFTSGTTSKSKPVMLTHRNLLYNATEAIMLVDVDQDLFTALPLYHTYGLTLAIIGNMINGVQITLNGDMKTLMRDMYLSKAPSMATVPLMMEAVHNHIWTCIESVGKTEKVKKLVKINLSLMPLGLTFKKKKLVAIKEKVVGPFNRTVCGGAHISKELSDELWLFGITVLQGYGITECSPLISANSMSSNTMGSVGHVLPSCQIKFTDDGEIWVKSPSVMQGYYKQPEQTAEALEDGWFKTGDLGFMDKKGFLYITGRKKNLIVFKNGKKVSPEKTEELISAIPLVKEVVVTGSASGISTDDVKITASICPDPVKSAGMTPYEVLAKIQEEIDVINNHLPSYQQIQLINIRETEFEKTSSKKIKRHTV